MPLLPTVLPLETIPQLPHLEGEGVRAWGFHQMVVVEDKSASLTSPTVSPRPIQRHPPPLNLRLDPSLRVPPNQLLDLGIGPAISGPSAPDDQKFNRVQTVFSGLFILI